MNRQIVAMTVASVKGNETSQITLIIWQGPLSNMFLYTPHVPNSEAMWHLNKLGVPTLTIEHHNLD